MIKLVQLMIVFLFMLGCKNNHSEKIDTNVDSNKSSAEVTMDNKENVLKINTPEFMETDSILVEFLNELDLNEIFVVSTKHDPYLLTGYFNDDNFMDTVIIVKDKKNHKEGLLIKHGNVSDYIVLGAGEAVLEQRFDDFAWIGVFKKIAKGELISSNIDDETGEIRTEDVADSLKIKLKTEGIYVHAFESCGGGIIYWDNFKYNWIQQE